MDRLTDKREMFCHEYLTDLNATQAAIRAGYSPKSAHVMASRLMANAAVRNRIDRLKAQRAEKIDISSAYVLKRLVEIDSLDVSDILLENGDIKDISKWPAGWRKSVQSIEVVARKEGGETAYVKKIKIPDKVKNLELLGRHTDILAFRDKTETARRNGGELVINVTSPETKEGIEQLRNKLRYQSEP